MGSNRSERDKECRLDSHTYSCMHVFMMHVSAYLCVCGVCACVCVRGVCVCACVCVCRY